MQGQRFELKYIVDEATARTVRDFVTARLDPDPHALGRPDLSYPVHSLYLDSESLALYWQTVNGNKNRYKLRMRFYSEHPDAPVFLEIKQRVSNAIRKRRCALGRGAARAVLAGRMPGPAGGADGAQRAALEEFALRLRQVRAVPVAQVSYLREAWAAGNGESVRVTVDRRVRCAPDPAGRLLEAPATAAAVFGDRAVVELKFTDRFPAWLRQMVHACGMRQCSAAKYVEGIERAGPELFARVAPAPAACAGPAAAWPAGREAARAGE